MEKALIIGCDSLPDGIYFITGPDYLNKELIKISYGGETWVDKRDCDVFQILLTGPFDANKIPKNEMNGYMIWDIEHEKWKTIEKINYEAYKSDYCSLILKEIEGDSCTQLYSNNGKWNENTPVTLSFQPAAKYKHNPNLSKKQPTEILADRIDNKICSYLNSEININDQILILGNSEVPDGIHKIIEKKYYGLNYKYQFIIEAFPEVWIQSSSCTVLQKIITGPFDANKIPKGEIKGYRVWDIENNIWREVEEIDSTDITLKQIDYRWNWYIFFNNGTRNKSSKTVYLSFQPPKVTEVDEINSDPTDELLLKVIDECPWLPRWCKDGICTDGSNFTNCPYGGAGNCPRENSVCAKIFGTYINYTNHGTDDCPCNTTVIGVLKVKSIKEQINILERERKSKEHVFRIGDCFKLQWETIHRLSKGPEIFTGVLTALNSENSRWGTTHKIDAEGIIKDQEEFKDYLKINKLIFIATFEETFINKDKIDNLLKKWLRERDHIMTYNSIKDIHLKYIQELDRLRK